MGQLIAISESFKDFIEDFVMQTWSNRVTIIACSCFYLEWFLSTGEMLSTRKFISLWDKSIE